MNDSRDNATRPAVDRPIALRRRPDVVTASLVVRGETWWRLHDPLTNRFWQFGEPEYFLWTRLDGRTSWAELQAAFVARFAPQRLELGTLAQFLGHLHREGLVQASEAGLATVFHDRAQDRRRAERWSQWSNLLALRLPGWNPAAGLEWLVPRVAWLLTLPALLVWLCWALSAAVLVLVNWTYFANRLATAWQQLTADQLIWLALVLIVVKGLHELGHAVVCRHLGGECREWGVMFLFFTPCLYCDVSSAWLLSAKWRRLAISAAGIGVELLLAASAAWLCFWTQPSLISTLAIYVLVVCSVNTLVLNGNPLLRYDGYFLLSDALDLPNLHSLSQRWWIDRLGQVLLGLPPQESVVNAGPVQWFLAGYGLIASVYRWGLALFVGWLFYRWCEARGAEGFAVLLLVSALIAGLIPVWNSIRNGYQPGGWLMQVRGGRLVGAGCLLLLMVGLLSFLPLPSAIQAPVVIRPAEAQTVYVTRPGTLVRAVAPGTRVVAGQLLGELSDPQLELEIERLRGERSVLERQLTTVRSLQLQTDAAEARAATERALALEQVLAELSTRLALREADQSQLILRAPVAGTVLPPRDRPSLVPADEPADELGEWSGHPLEPANLGCHLVVGTPFCLVGEPAAPEAIAVVTPDELPRLRPGQRAHLQLDEFSGRSWAGQIARIAEQGSQSIPVELLARQRVPTAERQGEIVATQRLFAVVVRLEGGTPIPWGATGWARLPTESRTVGQSLRHWWSILIRW